MGTHSGPAQPESAQGSDVFRELPGYRIVRQLGRGSMGVVYLAEDIALRRNVALKVLAPAVVDGELFRERFDRESRNAATLDHPNIIPVYAAGQAAGALYIAMRYVAGGDLRALLETNGPLSLTQASAIVTAMADALDAAHAHGIIHRDVKPANILIDNRNGQEHYYLSDFGIAKIASTGASLTSTGQVLGTIDYIAPEQVQGKPVDGRADLYALGCVLYRCLTGTVPFPREDIAAHMWAHVHETPPPVTAQRPDLPLHIDHILATAMAKQPEDRYPTCRELAQALHTLTTNPATPGKSFPTNPTPLLVSASMTSTYAALTPAIARPPVAATPPTRKWWQLAAGVVLTLALIAGSTVAILKYLNTRYPNTAEQALLDKLPPILTQKYHCTRTTGPDIANTQASITCTSDQNSYNIVFTKFGSPQALNGHFNTDVRTAPIGINPGDCRSAEAVESQYINKSGRTSGRALCYQDSGSSFIEWTDDKSQTLGRLVQLDSDDGAYAKLRDWWIRLANVKPLPPNLPAFEHPQTPPPDLSSSSSPAHPATRQAPEVIMLPERVPEATKAGSTAKHEETVRQEAQPINTPTAPGNLTSAATTASAPSSTLSTPPPAAPSLKLDGPTPDRPGPQQNGPRVSGKSSCEIDNGTYYCITRPAPIYQPQETDPDAHDHLPEGDYRFLCQSQGSKFTIGNHTSHWWAWVGDSNNGAWVPAIFLAGPHDDNPEPGLPICGSHSTTTTTPPTTSQPTGH